MVPGDCVRLRCRGFCRKDLIHAASPPPPESDNTSKSFGSHPLRTLEPKIFSPRDGGEESTSRGSDSEEISITLASSSGSSSTSRFLLVGGEGLAPELVAVSWSCGSSSAATARFFPFEVPRTLVGK